jgi:hypothetical protein
MNRKIIYIIVLVLVAAWSFGAWQVWLYLNPFTLKEDFEDGFGDWVIDTDVPPDPNNLNQTVEWYITRTTGTTHSGQYTIKLIIDGRQDDGTLWLERNFVTPRNVQVKVTVSFWLYSEEESFNTIAAVVGYSGTHNPETEEDLEVLGAANQVAGWKLYSFETTVNTGLGGEVWVALGISVRWETLMTYYVDDIEIVIR